MMLKFYVDDESRSLRRGGGNVSTEIFLSSDTVVL